MRLTSAAFHLLAFTPLLLASPAGAQELSEGEARITARSDVRMEIATGPGTRRAELETLGAAVGNALNAVRACYAERVEVDPRVQGKLVVSVGSDARRRAAIEVRTDDLPDDETEACTLAALRRVDVTQARPSSSVLVTLHFTNSAAVGQARMDARRATEAATTLEPAGEGKLAARGGDGTGVVTFRIVGQESQRDALVAMQGDLRTALPALLDCRRRSTRRDGDPTGVTEAKLTVGGNSRGRVTRIRTTVAAEGADTCVRRALQAAQYSAASRGRFDVTVETTQR